MAQVDEAHSAMAAPKAASPFVVAIIATYNRTKELSDLLHLLNNTPGVQGIVVADNAADAEVSRLVENSPVPAAYLPMEANNGVGPALNRAMAFACEKWHEAVTHFWILDDDVRFPSDTLEKLLAALRDNHAQFVAPVIVDSSGAVFARPRLKSGIARGLPQIRSSMGTCYLMDRVCFERLGGMREDFWLLGEDIEYTARIAQNFHAIFCPHVAVEHFWGAPLDPRSAKRSAYFKACAALQNNLFMLVRLPHTRFVFRSFLGSLKRFLRLHLASRAAAYDLFCIIWAAAVRGEPAGGPVGRRLRQRRQTYHPR